MTNTIARPSDYMQDSAGSILGSFLRLVGQIHAKPAPRIREPGVKATTLPGCRIFVIEMPKSATASETCDLESCLAGVSVRQLDVMVDMTRLHRVDSAGLSSLLRLLQKVSAAGGRLKLCGMTKSVRALFEITRMHHVFDIYTDSAEALQAFDASRA